MVLACVKQWIFPLIHTVWECICPCQHLSRQGFTGQLTAHNLYFFWGYTVRAAMKDDRPSLALWMLGFMIFIKSASPLDLFASLYKSDKEMTGLADRFLPCQYASKNFWAPSVLSRSKSSGDSSDSCKLSFCCVAGVLGAPAWSLLQKKISLRPLPGLQALLNREFAEPPQELEWELEHQALPESSIL